MTYSPDFRCEDCGERHVLDTTIPSHIWNAICENRRGVLPGASGIGMPEVSVLCTLCIDARLVKARLTAFAEFYFVGDALTSRLYAEDEKRQWTQQRCDDSVRYPHGRSAQCSRPGINRVGTRWLCGQHLRRVLREHERRWLGSD